jgi:hypothetical protein
MSEFKLTTPIAFIIFNRPDTTERVFAEIAKARPTKLLVVADGARVNKVGEADKVTATRAIIERVDWDCEVLTNFSDINLGCKHRVSSGIDWVFSQVEEAIVLEDDCLPDPTFFRFCQEMLERYKHDQRIGMISGDNFQFGARRNNDSYYFSKYVHIWGWATWRDRWQDSYDVELKKWPVIKEGNWLVDILGNVKEASIWGQTFDKMYQGKVDTWDYQWVFANWVEGRVNVMPNVNLISNIGFGVDATHTVSDSYLANLPVDRMIFPISHPVGIFINLQADMFSSQQFFNVPIYKKIYKKLLGHFK